MHRKILLVALCLVSTNLFAEKMNCNMSGTALFPMIDLDSESRSAVITDRFGKNTDGKITLVRKAGNDKNKFNVTLDYKLNNILTHIDLIIIPTTGDSYKVGMAGYVDKDKKKILDLAANDDAMCF